MKVFEGTDKEYYMDKTYTENLNFLMKAVRNKWDGFVMFDGVEGSAKTTKAAATGYYLNQDYNLDNVVFTQNQFNEAVDNARREDVIHWDEFVFGGLSTEAMNQTQNALIKKITTIRKKQLYILLCMPWFFMMRPYFAIGRSRCLVHTYSPDGNQRGFFKFYSYVTKRKLYHIGKKEYNYRVKADFAGRFTDTFGLFWDEKEYDKKKEKAIRELSKEHNGINKWEVRCKHGATILRNDGKTCRDIAKYFNVNSRTVNDWLLAAAEERSKSINNLKTNT